MSQMPTRWSYSSISTYEQCPAKWKYSYLDGIPTPPNAAMTRGSRLHAACEDYVNGKLMVLPFELSKVSIRIDGYKNVHGAKAEDTWTLDRFWTPTWGAADPDPWIKAIVDVHWLTPKGDILHVIDYKSGREYPEHREQLELYACIGMHVYPQVKRAEYGALYLDSGHVSNEGAVLRGTMLESKVDSWTRRAIKLFEDKTYNPTPSASACRWCDFHPKKGGQCRVGV